MGKKLEQVVYETKEQGLCGEIFTDDDGDQYLCIRKKPCPLHPEKKGFVRWLSRLIDRS